MEFKGTKGRWVLSSSENLNGRLLFVIQNAFYDSKPSDLLIHITSFSEVEIQKANALLISKAPEMLEMLKKISEFIDGYENVNYWARLLQREVPEIKQLIKEATEL